MYCHYAECCDKCHYAQNNCTGCSYGACFNCAKVGYH